MKHVAPCLISLSIFAAENADASPPTQAELTSALVQRALVAPLAVRGAREEGPFRFSRVPRESEELRLRVLDVEALKDGRGRAFRRFAIDARHPRGGWREEVWSGCAYLAESSVFVKAGEDYRAAAAYLANKDENAPTGTCRPASPSRS